MADWSRHFVLPLTGAVFLAATFAYSQTYYQDHEVQVKNPSPLVARSHDPADVLLASIEAVFHDKELCCGRRSALQDTVEVADPASLKDIATRLDGRHLFTDGRPFHVTAEFVTPDAVRASRVISEITDQHPLLMMWNSNLYVVYGVEYVRREDDSNGAVGVVIRKFLLLDTRYSDERRSLVFDRETGDPAKVQGLLFARLSPE